MPATEFADEDMRQRSTSSPTVGEEEPTTSGENTSNTNTSYFSKRFQRAFGKGAVLLSDIPITTPLSAFAQINAPQTGASQWRPFNVLSANMSTSEQAIVITIPTFRVVCACLEAETDDICKAFWLQPDLKSTLLKANTTAAAKTLASQLPRLKDSDAGKAVTDEDNSTIPAQWQIKARQWPAPDRSRQPHE